MHSQVREDLIGITRCRCGNRVTRKAELDEQGRCRACAREVRERLAAEAEACERAERIAFYQDSLSFWSAR